MAGDALREVFAEFGIEFDDEELQKGSRSVGGVIARVRELGAVLVGNEIVGAIREFANAFEEQAGALQDSASAFGVTTRELQELRFAAVSAGLGAGQADAAMQRFQQSVAGAAAGSKAQAAAFRAIGVNVRDSNGQVGDLSDLMDGVAAGLGRVEDPARRARLAVDIFGSSGARLATVMHEGEGGLAALRAELDTLGGGLLPEAIEAANDYGDATDRNKVAVDALRSVLATALLPALTWLVKRLTEAEAWLVRTARGTHVAELALVALGAAGTVQAARMLRAWAPVLLPFAKMALAIGLAVLAIDDLITLMNGGDSAIGRFLDSMAGVGTSQRFVQELKDAWDGLKLFLNDFSGDLNVLAEWFRSIPGEVSGAVNSLVADITRGAGEIVAPFTNAWNTIKAAFDETFGPIIARINSLVEAARGFAGLGTVASGAANALRGALPSVPTMPSAPSTGTLSKAFSNDDPRRLGAGGFLADALAEWRDVFSGANAALAPSAATQRVPAPASARPAVARTTNTTINAPISVSGVSDPEAAARATTRQIRERERAAHDAAHPVREDD